MKDQRAQTNTPQELPQDLRSLVALVRALARDAAEKDYHHHEGGDLRQIQQRQAE
jgi:hypothetical protein